MASGHSHGTPGARSRGARARGLQANAARGHEALRNVVGFKGTIGGWGQRSTPTDHDDGNALDAMTGNNREYGWQVANWAWENRAALGLTYIIFDGKIASASKGWKWRPYKHPAGRNDATALHRDHVHMSFRGGPAVKGPALTAFAPGAPARPAAAQPQTPAQPVQAPGDPRVIAAMERLKQLPAVHAEEIAAGRLTPEEARLREATYAYYVAGLRAKGAQERATGLSAVHRGQVQAGQLSAAEAAAREQSFGSYAAALQAEAQRQQGNYLIHSEAAEMRRLLAERSAMQPTPVEPVGPSAEDAERDTKLLALQAMEQMLASRTPSRIARPAPRRANLEEFDPAPLGGQLQELAARDLTPHVMRRPTTTSPTRSAMLTSMGQMVESAPPRASRESLLRFRR